MESGRKLLLKLEAVSVTVFVASFVLGSAETSIFKTSPSCFNPQYLEYFIM
jgi:hypothetical protein